jgi:redox-sensitive bicupin YhaK (pirin superfamily)
MLEGIFQHKHSHGHIGKLGLGDVQWMTAVCLWRNIHCELPEEEFIRDGRRMHGFQLWVNLAKGDKIINPHYQEIPSSKIPVAKTPVGKVSAKLIAGEPLNVNAIIKPRTPMIMYFPFTLQSKSEIEQQVPSSEHNAFA